MVPSSMVDGVSDLPLVSIVTPTLNRATMLERTLRSVRAQTYPNLEHLVVDGGSTDGTTELLSAYAGSYNLRWWSEPDQGMYDAVNKGMRLAHGDVVAYLNSDDLYFPWTVERIVAGLSDMPDADLIFGDVIRADEIRGILVPVFQPRLRVGRMAAFGTLFQPTVFMRRRVFEELHGFDDRLRYVADLDFWLRAARRFRAIQISEFLALEYRHPGMLSETGRLSMGLEDRRMRGSFRTGLWATRFGPIAAKIEWHLWSTLRWLAFVRSTRRIGEGWERTISNCGPEIALKSAVVGAFPSKGSRFRAAVRWRTDPRRVAPGPTDPQRVP